MSWWFLILGVSSLAVVWVAIALYVRVRKQMKDSKRQYSSPAAGSDSDHNLS